MASNFLRLLEGRLGVIFSDCGSKYAVSGCKVINRTEIDAAIKKLKSEKNMQKPPITAGAF